MKHTPLTIAAFNGRHEVIEVLLNRNANVNVQYGSLRNGFVPLSPRLLPITIRKYDLLSAHVNDRTSEGRTALMFAAMNRKDMIIRLLLNRGADPNIRDHTGKDAMWYAEESNCVTGIQLIGDAR